MILVVDQALGNWAVLCRHNVGVKLWWLWRWEVGDAELRGQDPLAPKEGLPPTPSEQAIASIHWAIFMRPLSEI